MRKLLNFLIFGILILIGCEDDFNISTDKNTYYDDISDITYLNNSFFTTNYDLSGNAGSQVDLIVLGLNENGSYLDDKFSLGLNGQGYLSITNDGSDLYLQSRITQFIYKMSSIGELSYAKYDSSVGTHWLPSGITYNVNNDSIISLYRNQNINNQYRLREISKEVSGYSHRDLLFEINNIDTIYNGIYSAAYANFNLYMLAVRESEDVLIIMNYDDLTIQSTEIISDSTVVGIEIIDNSIYLSFRDNRIEKFREL